MSIWLIRDTLTDRLIEQVMSDREEQMERN